MIDFGIVKPGTTIYIPFATYDSNDPSASVTLTGLATSDIEVYKNGSTTQRASDSGYALLDTDGIDFDSITGIHGFSINLADNTTAGFWEAGAQYWVVISSITVDAGTVNFVAATFRIGYPDAVLNTSIATLSSQTSFTLTVGPAEDDALNGMWAIIHDVASSVQFSKVLILDYTGSTKTVTLAAGATFTAAATDNISIIDLAPLQPTTTGRLLDVSSGGEAGMDWANVGSPTTSLALTGTTIATTQKVDIETIKTNPVVNAGTITFPTTQTLAAVGSAMTLTSGERDSIAAALLDLADAIESGITTRGAIRLMLSSLAGKLSGAATTTITIRNVGDTKDRVTATVDSDGNRTAITTDVT